MVDIWNRADHWSPIGRGVQLQNIAFIMVALCNRADHYIFILFMVALWNRADHYIFMLWFVMAALCNRGPLYFCPVVSFLLSFFYLLRFFLA